jgi:arsenate reductase
MSEKIYNVLFLCAGNSARSIFAEALIENWGQGKFRGYSAGSHPKGEINPLTLKLLEQLNFPTEHLRSKSWSEFEAPDAPEMDFVFTVCDKAATEECPTWPGQPMSAHWGVEQPTTFEGDGTQKLLAFRRAFAQLERRIQLFVNLPFARLDKLKLQQQLNGIGRIDVETVTDSVA